MGKAIAILVNSIFSIATYLGVGALVHVVLVGSQLDWDSASTWGVLLGWPFAVFGVLMAILLAGGVAVLALGIAWLLGWRP